MCVCVCVCLDIMCAYVCLNMSIYRYIYMHNKQVRARTEINKHR